MKRFWIIAFCVIFVGLVIYEWIYVGAPLSSVLLAPITGIAPWVSVGCGTYLCKQALKRRMNPVFWLLIGLCFSLLGLLFFKKAVERREAKTKPAPLPPLVTVDPLFIH